MPMIHRFIACLSKERMGRTQYWPYPSGEPYWGPPLCLQTLRCRLSENKHESSIRDYNNLNETILVPANALSRKMSTQGAETKTQSGSIGDSLKCLSGTVGGVAERIGIEDAIYGKIVRMKAGPNRGFRPGRETAAIYQQFLLSISYNTRCGLLQIL